MCEKFLSKIIQHEDLYSQYRHERDPFQKMLIVEEIALLKEDLRELELKLATLEHRGPRKLPLRPLPVKQLKIE